MLANQSDLKSLKTQVKKPTQPTQPELSLTCPQFRISVVCYMDFQLLKPEKYSATTCKSNQKNIAKARRKHPQESQTKYHDRWTSNYLS